MGTRACVVAMVAAAAILGLGLLPAPRPGPLADDCGDGSRLETVDVDRGRVRLLTCPVPCGGLGCPGTPRGAAALLMGRPIRIDLADSDELRALPGIGAGLAGRILRDREERGPVRSLGDLRRVKGFGAARLRALEGWAIAGVRGQPDERAMERDGSTR